MDDERFYKRMENLEKSSQDTAIQLAKLNAHIESETGNRTFHLDAIYKLLNRYDKIIFETPGLYNLPSAIAEVRDLQKKHQVEDEVTFEALKKSISWLKTQVLLAMGGLGVIVFLLSLWRR